MPVIGCGDDDRIYVRIREHLMVILVHFYFRGILSDLPGIVFLDQLFTICHAVPVHITYSHQPGIIIFYGLCDIVYAGDPAAANLADVDLIARGILAEDRSRYNGGYQICSCCTGNCFLNKFSSFHRGIIVIVLSIRC